MSQSPHLSKTRAISTMFDRIAPRYDLMNRLMSLGMDRAWRHLAVRAARPREGGRALDVGSGTADLALALAADGRARYVVGADVAAAMLRVGRRKIENAGQDARIDLIEADVVHLPFAGASFDCVTTAFMVRNLADLPAALQELRRVLMPGGRLVILEITRPQPGLRGALFSMYFHRIVPLIGGVISGDPTAYRYLPASVDRFLSADQLSRALDQAGFMGVRVRHLGPGPVALCTGVKATV